MRTTVSVAAVDPRTVRITTREATPFLEAELTSVPILSRRLHGGATTADFDNGRALVGTGAHRHVSYEQGDRLEVAANPD